MHRHSSCTALTLFLCSGNMTKQPSQIKWSNLFSCGTKNIFFSSAVSRKSQRILLDRSTFIIQDTGFSHWYHCRDKSSGIDTIPNAKQVLMLSHKTFIFIFFKM